MNMNNDLFLNNISYVKKIVSKFDYGYIEKDDLYQAGLIGLYKAVQNYDNKKNTNFLSYASLYIMDARPFSDVAIANISSKFLACFLYVCVYRYIF